MKRTISGIALALSGTAILVAALSGCGKDLQNIVLTNHRPEVRLSAAPVDTSGRYFYSYTVNWISYDPDGRVDYCLFAVDPPPTGDTAWVQTRENERRLTFSAGEPDPANPRNSRAFHVFVIKAVDDRGEAGPPVWRAFFSFTQAPSVRILNPPPSRLYSRIMPPSVRFTWTGDDPDGVFTIKPVKYKFILLGPSSDFSPETAIADPDSLRRYFAPDFAGWDSSSAETTFVQYTNLTPNASYVFAVIGIDEAGAFTPVFNFDSNMLRFRVGFATARGPRITFFNEFFEYTYGNPSYTTNPAAEIFVEAPAGIFRINWIAVPQEGADIRSFRWAVDILDVSDNTPRTNERTDVTHWSSPSRNTLAAVLGPYPGGEEHRFYLEAEDNTGLRSLGVVRFLVVQATLEKEMLIVDDTRLRADGRRGSACVTPPSQVWPTAAELDTFLYAVGGTPWGGAGACSIGVTPRGVFAGYDFDTLNTRIGRTDMTVRLSKLGQYRHVIWITDGVGATYLRTGQDQREPTTALRYMAAPGRVNTIGAYVKQGGLVWMLGGGAAMAATAPWDVQANNTYSYTFSSLTGGARELAAGRLMFDLAQWQSEIRCTVAPNAPPTRYTGRFGDSAYVTRTGSPYATLPPILEFKTPASDPMPINRSNTGEFYQDNLSYEFLQVENIIREDIDPTADGVDEQSTLDTLYRLPYNFNSLPTPDENRHNVAMTYYHGPAHPPFVFTGFPIWSYKRSQCVQLVDFVMNNLWNLHRTHPTAARRTGPAEASRPPTRVASSRVTPDVGSRPPRPWAPPGASRLSKSLQPPPAGPARSQRD